MNVGTVAAEAPTPTYDAATGNSAAAAVGSSPRARRSLDMGGGRRAAPVLPDFEGDVDHFVLPASALADPSWISCVHVLLLPSLAQKLHETHVMMYISIEPGEACGDTAASTAERGRGGTRRRGQEESAWRQREGRHEFSSPLGGRTEGGPPHETKGWRAERGRPLQWRCWEKLKSDEDVMNSGPPRI